MVYSFCSLWFDVGLKRYTTLSRATSTSALLWFDVGLKRYTTLIFSIPSFLRLWFDVGLKRYTTRRIRYETI